MPGRLGSELPKEPITNNIGSDNMKTLNISSILLVAIVFLAMGCSNEQAVNPTDNSMSTLNSGGLAKGKGPVVESVTGSGHLTRSTDPVGLWRTFSFNARRYADGSVEGTYEDHDHGWTYAKGPITCFKIVGNQAWLYCVVERSSEASVVGTQRVFRVIDNGEGANAAPDQLSLLHLEPAGYYCSEIEDWPFVYDIEAGNIQVKGGGGEVPTS
jgi:hypothetical protein